MSKILRARLFTENTLKSASVVMVCLEAYEKRKAANDCDTVKGQKTIISFFQSNTKIFYFLTYWRQG